MDINKSQYFLIRLEENTGTGYSWTLTSTYDNVNIKDQGHVSSYHEWMITPRGILFDQIIGKYKKSGETNSIKTFKLGLKILNSPG